MGNSVFVALPSNRISNWISAASRRVVYVAPGLNRQIATAILSFWKKPGREMLEVVVDCNDDVCRLGYGEIEAIRMLVDSGIEIRQSPGLRIGTLICDDLAWCFSPIALCVEDETQSDEMPNAIAITMEMAEQLTWAVCPESKMQISLFDGGSPGMAQIGRGNTEREIGIASLTKDELICTEQSLKTAPPAKFDIARQVRVFQAYLQYVELSLEGCSISRHTVKLPQEILNLPQSKEMRERLRTTYSLIGQSSKVSDKPLQEELKKIRDEFTVSLGKHHGRVMLKSLRVRLDKRVDQFRIKLQKHQDKVRANLAAEMDKSIEAIQRACYRQVIKSPPAELIRQTGSSSPTKEQAESWLKRKLRESFPDPEQVVSSMEFECSFKDITYETLNEPQFRDVVRREYPDVPWDKPFNEFDAAKAKQTSSKG